MSRVPSLELAGQPGQPPRSRQLLVAERADGAAGVLQPGLGQVMGPVQGRGDPSGVRRVGRGQGPEVAATDDQGDAMLGLLGFHGSPVTRVPIGLVVLAFGLWRHAEPATVVGALLVVWGALSAFTVSRAGHQGQPR